jgi:uncharacterized membrane protein YdjX (TVP38/TMEM64 family)
MTQSQRERRADEPGRTAQWLHWPSLLRAGLLLVVIVTMIWLVLYVDLPSFAELQDSVGLWRGRVEDLGWLALPAFAGAYAAIAVTPIPVTIMALMAGVLFGTVVGSLASVVGVLIGCWAAYWLARAVGQTTVRRILGRRTTRLEERLGDRGFDAVFLLRIMPGMPYWPVNYASGAFGVAQRDFAVATLLAAIPGQIALVAVGAFAVDPSVVTGIVVLLSWGIVLGMTVWSYRSLRGTADHELPGAGLVSADD